jgi:hypothetical protein
VTVSSDDLLLNGIPASATTDGWSIGYDRFLLTLGNATVDGDACNQYSEAGYTRIFNLKIRGPQKVSVFYALGQCDFGFRMGNPNADSLLGEGVTDADATFMRTPGTDSYTGMSGITAYVKGSARNGTTEKSFEWAFRWRVQNKQCTRMVGGTEVRGLDLKQKGEEPVDIQVKGGALFADSVDDAHPGLRFGIFADADTLTGNNDGIVTLDELARVPLAAAGFVAGDGGAVDAGSAFAGVDAAGIEAYRLRTDGAAPPGYTLEDYVYLMLFPRLARFRGDGTCYLRASSRGGRR